jgi:hypothetical protein
LPCPVQMYLLRAGIMGMGTTAIMAIMGIMAIFTVIMGTTTGMGIMGAIGTAAMSITIRRRWCISSIRCTARTGTTRTLIRRRACLLAGGISALGSVGFKRRGH